MEVLGGNRGTGVHARVVWAAAAAAALALTGCVLLELVRPREKPLAFSHAFHVVEEGLECLDCHLMAEDADDPGMPVLRQCMLCHDEIDAEKPPDRRIDILFEEGRFQAARVSRLSPEVVFSHLRHVEAGVDCASCHTGIEKNERVDARLRTTKADCMGCHEERGVAADCATCHSVITPEWQPPSHRHHWMRLHGLTVRAQTGRDADDCSLCHDEVTCTTCHKDEPPQNHTNHFRRSGHGMLARMDRESCSTCHTPDSCDACHAEMRPRNHVGLFGGTTSRHCLSCHFPLQSEQGCHVCHKATPSHALASPLPPDHHPAMNCRQCHGVTAPLPHVDKGDSCVQCHR